MSKINTSKNAITHGIYSKDVVFPWENQNDFENILQELRCEYCPEGTSEEQAVSELASLYWKKGRVLAGFVQAMQEQQDFKAKIADWELGASAKAYSQTVQLAYKLVQSYLEQNWAEEKADCETRSQPVAFDELRTLMKEVCTVGSNFKVQFEAAEASQRHQIERAWQSHIMEKELKLQAEIDRRIEKVLKRLVIVKEYKKQYVAKSVNQQQIELAKLPAKPSSESVEA